MRVEYNSGTAEFRFHALPPWEDGAPAGRKEKDVVKEAGCRFRKVGADAVWYTDRPEVAAQALKSSQSAGHAVRVDDAAKEALEKAIRARESAARAAETAAEASRSAASDAAIPAPAGLDYLPFQRAGISYILDRYADGWPGVILGDQMGLGKSIMLAGVVNSLPVEDGPVLVVCPASLKGNLARETLKWGAQGRGVHVWAGKEQPEFADGDVVIVNYDIVHKENVAAALKGGLAKLGRSQWALLACDEAHYLKNPQAKRTQAVLGDSYRKKEGIPALRRLLMTGTPITNKPKELWPLVDACVKKQGAAVFGPGGRDLTAPFTRYWNSYAPEKSFAGLFCGARQGRYGLEDDGASNLDLLQHGLRRSIMVRRTKNEVLKELPPKFRQVVEFAMESDDGVNADQAKAAAKAVKAEAATAGRHEKEIERLRAAVELAKASDDESAYQSAVAALRSGQGAAFAEMAKVRHETAVAKIPYVVSHIRQALDGQEREADGKRGGIIVFAHHTDVIEAIGEAFGPAARIAHGGTPLKTRQELVDAFQRGEFDVFVCQMQAMGVGHTLTRSSHVVFAELDWVPATISQAEDRAHRIGQVSSVLVQHLVLEGSMDATMARRLVEKQAVIDLALDRRADGTLPDMQEEDVDALIADRESEHEPPARAGHTTEATKAVSRERVAEWAEKLADQDVDDIHRALRIVAGACDGAKATDGGGFSKVDAAVGHALSTGESLTARQAALGLTLANRYRRQLPAELKDKIVFLWSEVKGSGGDRKSAGRSALLSAVAEATAGKADGISARTQAEPPRRKSGGHSL